MLIHRSFVLVFVLAVFAMPAISQTSFSVENAFPGLSFSRLVDLQHAGDGTNRLFAVEQHTGAIRVFQNDASVSQSSIFLDVEGITTSGEEGLLGLAFHPDYENNGYFFVYYSASNPRRSVMSRFSVDPANPDRADPASELIVLEIEQPYENHNGGQLAFGPNDGFLYIGLGDGGSAGDPQNNARNPKTLLGSMLRIDVNASSEAEPYAIPADNPFVGNSDGWREEIFAYGLRNPWRFSFDPETGDLWVGDVGQNRFEEIDLIQKGGNYGWDVMEASACFEPSAGCDQSGLILPVWEYNRDLGRSVTGGHVYHDARIPSLQGKYIYGDFASGRIWALTYDGGNPTLNEEILDTSINISTFGVAEDGSFFIGDYNGRIYRILDPSGVAVEDGSSPALPASLGVNYPNPFQTQTTLPFVLNRPAQVDLAIYDVLGRRVRTIARGLMPEGSHSSEWLGDSDAGLPLPGGVYFYRVQVNGALVETRMLTMVK